MRYFAAVLLMVAALVLAACVPMPASKATPTQGQTGLPNPASKYCVDKGGKLEIRDEAGGQAGYCVFSDGSECDEWAYFRGQCAPGSSKSSANMVNPASKFCTDQGYKWEARNESGGQVGYCIFPDGSECEEWAFYRGQCAPGGGKTGGNLPNPASKYCIDKGGKLDMRNVAGGQAGYCVFQDGSECDEWAFFRGQCAPGSSKSSANMVNPASKFCTDQGYKWEARNESGGQVGYCIFPDGSECEEWAYYRGQCAPGSK